MVVVAIRHAKVRWSTPRGSQRALRLRGQELPADSTAANRGSRIEDRLAGQVVMRGNATRVVALFRDLLNLLLQVPDGGEEARDTE